MLKKKLVSVLLVLSMCLSLPAVAFAGEQKSDSAAQTYMAQIYHAIGVDEYGSNIQEVSEVFADVPVAIKQSANNLVINFQDTNIPITINATVRGKNTAGNMLYYDVSELDDKSLSVMMLAYIENFSKAGVLSSEYCEKHPDTKNVLEIYLKVANAECREYYFIEIFDFTLDSFSQNNSPECDVSAWYAKEFSPIRSYVIENEDANSPYATYSLPYTTTHTFVYEYLRLNVPCKAVLEVEKTDDISNVGKGETALWIHSLEIVDTYTECSEAPEFSRPYSDISLTNVRYEGNAPLNCAFQTMQIDGIAVKRNIFAGILSATLNVGLGPLTVSADLGALTNLDTVDINNTFTGFINKGPNNMTKAISVNFTDKYYLYDEGNYFQVAVQMKDYGDVATELNKTICQWVLTASDEASGNIINEDYVLCGIWKTKVQ